MVSKIKIFYNYHIKAQLCFIYSLCSIYEGMGMHFMIANYTLTEVEYTLYLYPIAKLKSKEFKKDIKLELNNNITYHHYSFIVNISEYWMSKCTKDEIEIIRMRFFKHKNYDFISIHLGYKNHSSIIRKFNNIIKKLCFT